MEEKIANANLIAKKYTAFNVEQFKNWLLDMKENGQPRFIEVYVDDMKVVPKTDKIEEFDRHEQYLDDETKKIRVLVYGTEKSNRYKQHIFRLKENSSEQVNGTEVQKKIEDGINLGLERADCKKVKEQLEEKKEELKNAEAQIEKLTAGIELLKEKLGGAEARKEVMGYVKEFAPFLLPTLFPKKSAALSGNQQTETKPENEAGFKAKNTEEKENEYDFSEDEKSLIAFGKSLRENFSKEEFTLLLAIIDAFVKDKTAVKPVHDLLLNINANQQKTEKQNEKV